MKKLTRTNMPQQYKPTVLQFGGGNFLRGFADYMIDVMNEQVNFNGAVQIVLSVNKEMKKTLEEQQGLYHVVTNGLLHGKPFREIRLITCIADALDPTEDYESFLQAALNPDLKIIISNTTEAGIAFNEQDLPSTLASTFPGKLTQFLFHRFQNGDDTRRNKIIVLPCELITGNGEQLRNVILQYSKHWQLPVAFHQWLDTQFIFCNTLVDRIVPGFPKENADELQSEIGYDDKLMITAEPFHFWAIQPCSKTSEDIAYVKQVFPAQQAGLQVQLVTDLTPYQTRKVRILNGAHTALTPVAYLSGQRFVKESIDHPAIGNFIRRVIFEEIMPCLHLPADDLTQFANDVIDRFKNPYVKHELSSIALNSISKFKVRVLPSIITYLETKKRVPENLMLSWAALICFYRGEWRQQTIKLNDTPEVLKFFKDIWSTNPTPNLIGIKALSNEALWGQDLSSIDGLLESLTNNIAKILSAEKAGNETILEATSQPMMIL